MLLLKKNQTTLKWLINSFISSRVLGCYVFEMLPKYAPRPSGLPCASARYRRQSRIAPGAWGAVSVCVLKTYRVILQIQQHQQCRKCRHDTDCIHYQVMRYRLDVIVLFYVVVYSFFQQGKRDHNCKVPPSHNRKECHHATIAAEKVEQPIGCYPLCYVFDLTHYTLAPVASIQPSRVSLAYITLLRFRSKNVCPLKDIAGLCAV